MIITYFTEKSSFPIVFNSTVMISMQIMYVMITCHLPTSKQTSLIYKKVEQSIELLFTGRHKYTQNFSDTNMVSVSMYFSGANPGFIKGRGGGTNSVRAKFEPTSFKCKEP